MVYVLSKDGQPLMPTDRHGKVRHLLKEGKAVRQFGACNIVGRTTPPNKVQQTIGTTSQERDREEQFQSM